MRGFVKYSLRGVSEFGDFGVRGPKIRNVAVVGEVVEVRDRLGLGFKGDERGPIGEIGETGEV